MEENLKTPLRVSFVNNSDTEQSFMPYKDFVAFPVSPLGKVSFTVNNSEEGMYYKAQNDKKLSVSAIEDDRPVIVGKYNAQTGVFTEGAPFNIKFIDRRPADFDNYEVVGTLPYSAITPEIGQPAGNRFTVKVRNPEITSKSQLPSGKICVVDVEGGSHNEYTKSAFEDDGSLFVVVNAENNTTLTLNIKWVAGDEFTNYQFTFAKVKLGTEGEELKDLEDLEINLPATIKFENISDKAVSFIAYKEEQSVTVDAYSSLTINVDYAGAVLYYLLQATETFKVTIL